MTSTQTPNEEKPKLWTPSGPEWEVLRLRYTPSNGDLQRDQWDFQHFLRETGFTEATINANLGSVKSIPRLIATKLAESPRHGVGVYALKPLVAHEPVEYTSYGTRHICEILHYLNHSSVPNCVVEPSITANATYLLTTRDIPLGEELTLDYRQALRVLPIFEASK